MAKLKVYGVTPNSPPEEIQKAAQKEIARRATKQLKAAIEKALVEKHRYESESEPAKKEFRRLRYEYYEALADAVKKQVEPYIQKSST